MDNWEWKNILPWPVALSPKLLRKASAQLFTCEFPSHFKRMEKSHHGQTADFDSR